MNASRSPFERIAQSDVAFLGTDPVPAKAYYDPTWYARERGTQLVAKAEGKPLGQHDTAERNLMKLCLSLAHVAQAVEMQGDDEDKHTPSRNAMRFTRSVADQEPA